MSARFSLKYRSFAIETCRNEDQIACSNTLYDTNHHAPSDSWILRDEQIT